MRLANRTTRPFAEFLAENTPNRTLERLCPMLRVLTQGVVDEGLVAASTSGVHLLPKPIDHVVVEAYGDPGLSAGDRNHSAPPTLPKVVFLLHLRLPSYCRRSLRVAGLAEISRMRGPRQVYDDQDTAECVGGQSDKPLFIEIIVGDCDGQLVVQGGGGVSEVDSVLLEVRPCLGRVPLNLHAG